MGGLLQPVGNGPNHNIAALPWRVGPKGVCLSSAAYEQVRDKLKYEFVDLGEKHLKNIARPVRAALQDDKENYLIYHAMGPNLAGVFGTAISGGIMLALLGVK